jgi:hypothetical protein
MNKEYCRHCVCLLKGPNGEWFCDSHSQDDISTFDQCPEDATIKCPECYGEYNSSDWGHEVDSIREFDKCTECLGKCPYCLKEMEALPDTINKITHGYVVQQISTKTGKHIDSEFITLEGFWEDDEGNHVSVPVHNDCEEMPIRIVQPPAEDIEFICNSCERMDVPPLEYYENAGMCWQCRDAWKKEIKNGKE